MNYILDERKNVVPCENIDEWTKWMCYEKNTKVQETMLSDDVYVSTLFLGSNYSFVSHHDASLFFETMAFEKDRVLDKYTKRYSSYLQAFVGHFKTCSDISTELNLITPEPEKTIEKNQDAFPIDTVNQTVERIEKSLEDFNRRLLNIEKAISTSSVDIDKKQLEQVQRFVEAVAAFTQKGLPPTPAAQSRTRGWS